MTLVNTMRLVAEIERLKHMRERMLVAYRPGAMAARPAGWTRGNVVGLDLFPMLTALAAPPAPPLPRFERRGLVAPPSRRGLIAYTVITAATVAAIAAWAVIR
jgi:hypothetical protein